MLTKRVVLAVLAVATAMVLAMAGGARAAGSGSLTCTLAGGGTPPIAPSGDYTLFPGDSVSCTISDVTVSASTALSGTMNVFVKHGSTPTTSNYPMPGGDNEVIVGTYSNGTISFTYDTAGLSTCNTAALSYENTSGAVVNSKGAHSTFLYGSGFACGSGSTTPPDAVALTASASDSTSFTRTYDWSVAKSADRTRAEIPSGSSATFQYAITVSHTSSDSAFAVAGTITASNPNAAAVSNVAASVDGCTVSTGPQAVPAHGSASFDFTCSYASSPPSTLSGDVSWPSQTLGNGSPLAAGTGAASAGLDWSQPTTSVNPSVDVSDSQTGDLGPVSATADPNPTVIQYPMTFTGSPGTCTEYPNTATIAVDGSAAGSDSRTVTVCDASDLTAAATAGASYQRTYTWSIAKSVDRTLVEKVGGGTATLNYAVSVSHDAGTDGGWEAHGAITVTNPNDWESITANVADAIDNGGTCTVQGGDSVTIPASGSVTLDYTCTYGSSPTALTGTNTATASWDAAAAATSGSSAWATSAYDFGAPAIVNGSTGVGDTLKGSLGTVSYTDASPTVFAYALALPVPTFNCVTQANTASLSLGGTATARVELCGPASTGALSMGYWSNKNGQAQIAGSAATAGVCNAGTFLRGYAPFQDLSATASCSAVNSYVQTVIKAANAAGASMNAMLKAQMLAVSLDAFFSSSSLANVSIDLTHVGAAGEDVSSSFGGAHSLTIGQMLAYAASQSSVGGSTWYGQNKAAQALAKDAFDAIANQLVFSP